VKYTGRRVDRFDSRSSSKSRKSIGPEDLLVPVAAVSRTRCSASTAIRSSANTDSVKWRRTGQISVSRNPSALLDEQDAKLRCGVVRSVGTSGPEARLGTEPS